MSSKVFSEKSTFGNGSPRHRRGESHPRGWHGESHPRGTSRVGWDGTRYSPGIVTEKNKTSASGYTGMKRRKTTIVSKETYYSVKRDLLQCTGMKRRKTAFCQSKSWATNLVSQSRSFREQLFFLSESERVCMCICEYAKLGQVLDFLKQVVSGSSW